MKLIVEMEMPKFCMWCDDKNEPRRCPLLNEDDDCVLQGSNIRMSWNEQYAHCPIKGVLPEQHGRLIDEAVFCENVVKYSHQSTKTIGKALDATPTIIEMTPNDGQEEVNQ